MNIIKVNFIKDTLNHQHSSCRNENILFAIYFFTHTKCIFSKRRINLLSNPRSHEKIKGFGEKSYRTTFWQLKFKV